MSEDPFEVWLGRIGQDRMALRHLMRASINKAGGIGSGRGRSSGKFGRGSSVAALLSTGTSTFGRRVVVKAHIVRLAGRGLARAAAHLGYLQRDGTTRDGERSLLYGPEEGLIDQQKRMLERSSGDRHQFRFIVAPEDGAEYPDLKPLVRRWVSQLELDLGTKLDWVAVDHFNTGHPHSHVIIRGKDDRGKDLVIAPSYMSHGLRERAAELVDFDLGRRSPDELLRSAAREVEQERLTSIDRRLVQAIEKDGLVRPGHPDPVEQSMRAGRLQTLRTMDLAVEEKKGAFRLAPDFEQTLRRMSERRDIIRTIQREMVAKAPERLPSDYDIYDPTRGAPILGKVIARGHSLEEPGGHHLIVDGADGRTLYVHIGVNGPAVGEGSLVRILPTPISPAELDRNVAAIAAENGRRYSSDLHRIYDVDATNMYVRAHVRRLNEMRQVTDAVERQGDGSWIIAPDFISGSERERAYMRQRSVEIKLLSPTPVEHSHDYNRATWLDRELVEGSPTELGHGYGAEVRKALELRRRWLVDQQLAREEGNLISYRTDLLSVLRQRELRGVADQLCQELGLRYAEARTGDRVEGLYQRPIEIGGRKFALLERSHQFSLVPWQPALDRSVGRHVSGLVREDGVSWEVGRQRSGPSLGL